jgi:spermidine synthase
MGAAHLLSFLMGFLSLSQEILWVRMASFAYAGAPQAFGIILALYLLGIALGANWGKRYCARGGNLYFIAAGVLLFAAVMDMAMPWLVVFCFGSTMAKGSNMMMVCVLLTALLKSIVFPIAHHLGSSASAGSVGSSVSRVYFANIAGSTLGPLVTGFVILQYFTLQQSFALMAGATLLTAAFCWLAGGGGLALPTLAGSATLAATFLVAVPPVMLSTLINNRGQGAYSFKEAVENRYGIIHLVHADDKRPDIVYGGNAYDGRINTDYLEDSNLISRVYLLAAVKPQPKRVLVLGMSAGSWTQVLQSFPGVEHIDVLEINPGYVNIVREYDSVRPILRDPRIAMHFDDGRRWLKRHPQEQYDLVVMNTTFHYRAYITMLLSQDFLQVMRQHMLPGAVLAFNSTGSEDAYKTAASVFGQVYRLRNFVVAGDTLALPDEAEIVHRLEPLIDVSRANVLAKVHADLGHFTIFDERQAAQAAGRPLEIITDQNMLTEYKYGAPLLRTLGWTQ